VTQPPSPEVERFLERCDGVKRSGNDWVAFCPCRNDDSRPTLSIGQGRDGRVLLNCHRGGGCTPEEICAAVKLEMRDLHPNAPERPDESFERRPKTEKSKRMDGKLVATYSYTDANGEVVLQVLRFRNDDGTKDFRQRVPDPDAPKGWTYSIAGLAERPLYHLPEVLEAGQRNGIVFVVEGEKDVDALRAAGYTATCNPMGADNGKGSKWKLNHTDALAGCRVVVVADNDEPGLIHANYVATQLTVAGVTVKRKQCPPQYKDVSELLDGGGTVADLIEIDARERDADPLSDDDVRLEIVRAGRLVGWREFIDETTSDAYDWLIEGILERGERVMVVAAEGVGKTTLARQVAILSGAGINPFTYCEMRPLKTLMVDLENPEKIIRRQSRRIVEAVNFTWDKRRPILADLWMKPDGIDILTSHGKALLEEQIERSECELLVLGPIYKSFLDPGNKSSTALITEVTMYFDYIRARYGCALWLEHHAPLGNSLTGRQIRPADSAVWMRWPEFGFGIVPDATAVQREYVWEHWRGMREDRLWPARMKRGALFPFEVLEYFQVP
jgi:5S rRNA maturation endonuclease (ribonuclease M5)